MEPNPGNDKTTGSVLVVADWTADAQAVVDACATHQELRGGALGLVVPALLRGLDWVGDPTASIPCAERQLSSIGQLAAEAGFRFDAASVGDPDPLAAICDALADLATDELLLCTRAPRVTIAHCSSRARRPSGREGFCERSRRARRQRRLRTLHSLRSARGRTLRAL